MKIISLLSFSTTLFAFAAFASVAQDEVLVDPTVTKVELENDQIRVLRISIAPHQKTHLHSHPSRSIVTITPNQLLASFPDGTSKLNERPAHELFWTEPVTHEIENLSGQPMQNIEIEFKQTKGAGVEEKIIAVSRQAQGTESDPVPVEQEPHHRVVFANQYVRIMDVVVKPGEATLFHKHSLDNVAVILTGAKMKRQFAGEDWADSPSADGSVGFAAGTKKSYTHRIQNVGDTTFHVVDFQVLP